MFRNIKVKVAVLFTFVVIGAIFASSASAECGPSFKNKAQAVNYYKTHKGAAKTLKQWLLAHPVYEYSADQGLIQYLEQSNVRVFNAPQGYKLTKNTQCLNGPAGGYSDYPGLLDNMSGKPMLWLCNKAGKCYPILKGYCRNGVMGPPVIKKPPKKASPPKKKCPCKKKPKKPKKVCKATGGHMVNGSCVRQENKASANQDCKGTVSGNQCIVTQTQINIVCGNASVGNSGDINQGGNCNTGGEETCVGQNNCNTTHPPEPPHTPEEPKPEPEGPEVIPDKIQEFEFNETAKEAPICARVRPGAGSSITGVFLEAEYGKVQTPSSYQASGEKYCNQTYKAPSGYPPFECTEPGLDAIAKYCDILTWTAKASNGTKAVVQKQVPIIPEKPF